MEKEEDLINVWIENTAGQHCWGMAAGGRTGTAFILRYGAKLKRDKPVSNQALSEDCRLYESNFSLFVHSAQWKLGTDHNGIVKRITDSKDDCSPDGPMVAGLEFIVENVIESVTFDCGTHDLNLYFRKGHLRLKVFGNIPKGSFGYSLYLPKCVVSIEEGGQIKSEEL